MPNQPYPRNIYPQISASLDTQQFVGKVGSAVTGNFQYGRSTWSEKWAVHPNELQLFVDDVLGYAVKGGVAAAVTATVAGGDNDIINRHLPARSYQFPQMYAVGIPSVEMMAPTGNSGGRATFKESRATIQFETPSFDMLTNAQAAAKTDVGMPPECWRYVVWNRQPATEFARTAKDAFRYPSGSFPTAHSPITGSGGQLFLITKYRITANWLQVPSAWITNNGLTFPALDTAVGHINDDEFLGYPEGTMLFESYVPTPRVMPVSPEVLGILDPGVIPRCYDVELKFLYFDPQPIYEPLGQVAPRGHNLAYNPAVGKWMRAIKISVQGEAGENTPANWVYPEEDLTKIFKAV